MTTFSFIYYIGNNNFNISSQFIPLNPHNEGTCFLFSIRFHKLKCDHDHIPFGISIKKLTLIFKHQMSHLNYIALPLFRYKYFKPIIFFSD